MCALLLEPVKRRKVLQWVTGAVFVGINPEASSHTLGARSIAAGDSHISPPAVAPLWPLVCSAAAP